MRDILFIHINFPGQFVHLAKALARSGRWKVFSIGGETARGLPGIRLERYAADADGLDGLEPVVRRGAVETRRALAVAAVCRSLREQGCDPAVVVGHSGWGEMQFVRDVFPHARIVSYLEFYFSFDGADVNFDPEFPPLGVDARERVRARNAPALFAAVDSDALVTPTQWQASRFPADIRARLDVVHEGVDTRRAVPDPSVRMDLGDVVLSPDDEVVTYVARNLEPYRGFHVFMRALPRILENRPNCKVLVIGGDGTSYGTKPPRGRSWTDTMLEEVGSRLDRQRVHFLGPLPYEAFLAAMQISTAHIYLTYPFVLSWSLLEAMSCGALVIGSRTPPVEEIVTDGANGLLVDFFNAEALAARVCDALERRADMVPLRRAARDTIVERYDLRTRCLPAQLGLIDRVAGTGVAAA
jgi:glycosyltransferase involved in cell wall biosynthesis